MKIITCILILSVSFAKASDLEWKDLDKNLGPVVHVSLVYRHGERTPTWFGKDDAYKDIKYWPEGYGQLTKEGMLHHYKLGEWLRLSYAHLIPNPKLRTRSMCTQSSIYDRTIMSALSSLAGMFPPEESGKFTDLKWQPTPVYTESLKTDKLVAMEDIECRSYDKEFKNFLESEELKKLNKFVDLVENITESTGLSITTTDRLRVVYSTLLIYEMAGLELPAWSNGVYPELLKKASDFTFLLPTYTTKMKRLKSGPLLKTIIKTFDEKINNDESRMQKCTNITAYSTHANIVANFLNTLGVFNRLTPPFAAMVLVELRQLENNYYVDVLYKNQTDPYHDPHVLQVPGCDIKCPFDKFKQLLAPVTPDDWDKECNEDN
ncbi:testicular acid phosphatase homolog [Cimex lectularius]|uniref:acid phosphatase n=1 Tax=Cimex lectularius TaxID=79782 RepID=A0A8I6R5Z6_CIMLE|nr:testicular acid phosphatase homolog [Cimex lectularius]